MGFHSDASQPPTHSLLKPSTFSTEDVPFKVHTCPGFHASPYVKHIPYSFILHLLSEGKVKLGKPPKAVRYSSLQQINLAAVTKGKPENSSRLTVKISAMIHDKITKMSKL